MVYEEYYQLVNSQVNCFPWKTNFVTSWKIKYAISMKTAS